MAEGDALGTLRAAGPGGEGWQAVADRLVREHRFTIAVVVPLVGAVVLVASAESLLGPPLRFHPLLVLAGTLVMRLPLLVGLAPLVDRRVAAGLAALAAFAYGVEFLGVSTGWPYGHFEYGVDLGPMLLGSVPVGLPLFYLPLVVDAYLLALVVLGRAADSRPLRLGGALAAVLLVDLVLDPGAVAVGFWRYEAGGLYGVPFTNYAGWVLSGAVAVAGVEWVLGPAALRERLSSCEYLLDDLVSFVLLWGAVNALYAQWVPVALACLLGAAVLRSGRVRLPLSHSTAPSGGD